MKYKHLFSPIKINEMIVKNRIVATPINDTFEEKALGGAGIVIAGHAIVEPGRSSFKSGDEPYLFDKYKRQETRRRVLRVQQAGAKASIEIFHGGREARVKDFAKGPHDMVREDGTIVKAMDEEMMAETLEWYKKTAIEAKAIGFDMLFMHFGHGWLPAQFLSPHFNQRTDKYGGVLENRVRFPLEILRVVREAVGPKFPIDMRISAYEWVEGSISFEDVVEFIKMSEEYIDTVQISAGLDMNREANVHMATTNFSPYMPNVKWAEAVKEKVSIPVSVVGAVLSPEEADDLIASGKVDMVAFGRSFVADPYWPKKALEGRPEDIAPCLRCLQCYHIATEHRNVGCSVNPRYNNEAFIPLHVPKAEYRKHVVIIGGGPAGMKAAVTSAQRGHKVTLIEKEKCLGGQLRFVAQEHYKDEVKRLLRYLTTQVGKHDINVMLNTEADRKLIEKMAPDSLIVAVGGHESRPPIVGLENVTSYLGTQIIGKENQTGQKVLIIGGGTIGSEIALELAELYGRDVRLVELGSELVPQANQLYKIALRQKMAPLDNLMIHLETSCVQVSDGKAILRHAEGTEEVDFDTLILCTGVVPNLKEAFSFYDIVPETNMIGDCIRPRKIQEAIFEGHSLALTI
ncbi:TPA: FAD-dependent oxidoreductase [Streptococcus suis]|nr:FAD-dependent oxidoreductase [Streptococcus suis]HEL2411876.1 FAD-dependent oxidoreductase [Streptococcus suis]